MMLHLLALIAQLYPVDVELCLYSNSNVGYLFDFNGGGGHV